MTFIDSVNRLLRLATLLQWDDPDILTFSNTQFAATITLARQSIQHVTNDLIADNFLFPEEARETITTVASQQKYALAADFVRFKDKAPWFQQTDAGVPNSQFLSEYPGKEAALKKQVPKYETDTGTPQWFYFTDDQEVGIYPLPASVLVYRYDYQKDVMPENESDSLPVQSEQMAYAYVDMAVRVFTFLFSQQPITDFSQDVVYNRAKAALMALNVKEPPLNRYGFRYA